MEKRLIDTYDHMTMPEDCARKIEARLQAELQSREAGRYTKVAAPDYSRRNGWGIVAACLLLVLVMGGTLFGLWMTTAVETPTELAADYSVATDIPADQVEAFAAEVRKNILEEDWEAFSEKITYPVAILVRGLGGDTTVKERSIEGPGGMVGLFLRNTVNPSFLEEIRRESCKDMFCNWQGVTMADGRIWINEVDGVLKITSINGVFADTPDAENFVLKLGPNGFVVTAYNGQDAEIVVPGGNDTKLVMQIGEGESIIRYGDKVRFVTVPGTVQVVEAYAFADCPALEAVYFEGDAPPEGEGVFEGSDNVTVYHQHGADGWGDTWCGRKTLEYGDGHLSLGVVVVPDEYEKTSVLYENILQGTGTFYSTEAGQNLTLEKYCTSLEEYEKGPVSVAKFTLADMDADGNRELILWLCQNEKTYGFLILRVYDGNAVRGWLLPGAQMHDLKKDGSFLWIGNPNAEENRLRFSEEGYLSVVPEEFSQQDKAFVQWHVYPCQGSALVLDSYRYATETGAGASPGYGYYYFEDLAYGTMANDWSQLQYWLNRQMICREDGNMAYAYDSDAPGCVFYGTLTGEGDQRKFSSIGYYICDETGEYRAEVFDLDQPNPVYTIDPPSDDRGREVETVEEMMAYLGHVPYYDSISRDVQQIAELLDRFVGRYVEHDMDGMQECMADTAGDLSSYPFAGRVSILTYGILPDAAMNIGEKWATTVELLESGIPQSRYLLDVILVKQTDGWKIQTYSIEKQ